MTETQLPQTNEYAVRYLVHHMLDMQVDVEMGDGEKVYGMPRGYSESLLLQEGTAGGTLLGLGQIKTVRLRKAGE